MGNFRLWFSRQTRHLASICLALALASVVLANEARAQTPSNDQAAQTAIQIISGIADVAGAPAIPPEVASVMVGMVGCAQSSMPLGQCAANVAIKTALSDISQSGAVDPTAANAIAAAAGCLTGGQFSAAQCVAQVGASALPPEAQPLATCIGNGGDLAGCAEKAALTVATQQLGANLPPEAASMVQCVIGGTAMTSCASSLVKTEVDQALSGPAKDIVDGLVDCVGKPRSTAGDCAKSVAINNIPAGPAKDFATCLSRPGANAQTCVANVAANNISDPTAKAVVGCMGNTSGDAAQQCIAKNAASALGSAAQQAAQQALSSAMATATAEIASLQPGVTAAPEFPQKPAILTNLLEVAKGIKDGNWAEVVEGVGPEALETAGKVILSIFLTPALSNILAPVVDSMIQNDVTSFQNGMKDLSNADAVGVAEDIFKWYATTFIQAPCQLMPSGAFTNAVCNGLATAINKVADLGGDLAKAILGLGEDVLKALGLWNFVDNTATDIWKGVTSVIDDIGHFLGLGDNGPTVVCQGWPSPSDYFANNVLAACLSPAAANATLNGGAVSSQAHDAVAASCVAMYESCPIAIKANVVKNCGQVADALSQAASNTSAAIMPAAWAYAKTAVPVIAASLNAKYQKAGTPANICTTDALDAQESTFVGKCTAALGAHFNMPVAPPGASCPITDTDALTQACRSAFGMSEAASLAGPNGSLCAKEEATADACGKPQTFTGDGTDITIILPQPCFSFKLPPGWRNVGGPRPPFLRPANAPVNLFPFKVPVSIVVNLLPPVVPGGSGTTSGTKPPPKLTPTTIKPGGIIKPFPIPVTGNSSGGAGKPTQASTGNRSTGGGTNWIEGGSGNSPTVKGSSSGGRSNPMDQLQGQMSGTGIANVTGNAGGAGFGPAIHPRPLPLPGGLGPRPTGVVVANPKGGGTGGTNGNSGSGGAPRPPGQNAGGPRPPILPRPKAPASPPADQQIDYGGCSANCGQPRGPVVK